MTLTEEQIDGKTVYKCSCCGMVYEHLPLGLGWDKPYYFYEIPENEREARIELTKSLCIIDEEYFYHRGELIIPVVDYDEDLSLFVWTSISKEDYEKRLKLWGKPERVNEAPYFGRFHSTIPTYESINDLKSIAHERECDRIPLIEIIEENHPLTLAQSNGITLEKAKEIIGEILGHGHKS